MIARVTLEIALRREFDYVIPPELERQVDVGTRVRVPFGRRQVLGIVTALAEESAQTRLKPIVTIVGTPSLVTPRVLALARWISDYYCCPLEISLKSVLPEAVRREEAGWVERLFVRALPATGDFPKLPKRQLEVWNLVEERRELPLAELLALAETTAATVKRLEDRGLIEIAPRVAERDPYGGEHFLPTQALALNAAQRAALDQVRAAMDRLAGDGPCVKEDASGTGLESQPPPSLNPPPSSPPRTAGPREVTGAGASPAPALKGAFADSVEAREGASRQTAIPRAAWGRAQGPGGLSLDPRASAASPVPTTFLLHGVTGSGKTEVYLQAIAHALERGRGAIVLVPEISLTPQTVERFKARFSHGPLRTLVAVLHSHLSAGERHDEWHKIRQGRARIVIGARSAIFAPVEPLGLIIVDEEHEHTYKQEEAPRYHARDVAVLRGQLEGAVVVLGSATPSLESYWNARRGKYALLELPERADDAKMPYVRVVDMRQAARGGKGAPIFSPQLKEAITQRLERGEQTILFLNRRGYSTALECMRCGYVAECPNCSLSLTFHRREQKLACHLCGHVAPVPPVCPNEQCRNPAIRYSGLGTEKVEDTLRRLFPHARVERMDSDVMKRKEDYRRVLGEFRAGKIDVLVGTQMIAKGLHFPNVTLVGIIYADLALHQPDFRAGERTFQLLTQVAGRAGRGDLEGEVFVQAFTPFHPAIQHARRHDYAGFYEQEIAFREQLHYPPLARVALLTLKGRNEEKVKFSAEHVRRELEALVGGERGQTWKPRDEGTPAAQGGETAARAPELPLESVGEVVASPFRPPAGAPTAGTPLRDLILCGPAPAPLLRAETYYRYQLMLRTRQMTGLSRRLARLTAALTLPEDVTLTVDIDPVDLA